MWIVKFTNPLTGEHMFGSFQHEWEAEAFGVKDRAEDETMKVMYLGRHISHKAYVKLRKEKGQRKAGFAIR